MSEPAVQIQPSDREGRLRSYVIPRAMNICEYLDKEGIAKIKDGHQVQEIVRIPAHSPDRFDLLITINVRKAE